MPDPSPTTPLVLDGHESRGLASTILIARELLDHDALDEAQRQTILRSLARAATSLAHLVTEADEAAADDEHRRLEASSRA